VCLGSTVGSRGVSIRESWKGCYETDREDDN
jgi:hypothetical protein